MIDLVVFDLDGTLVDSRRDLADAANEMLSWLGAAPLPEYTIAQMVGEGASVLVRRALAKAGLDPHTPRALEQFLACYDRRLLDHTAPYAGIPNVLERLSGSRRLAVLTNKPSAATLRLVEGLGLRPMFQEVVGGDTPDGRKPSPAGLLGIVRRTGASPASTLLVGDSNVDLLTARAAGVPVCLARYGFGFRFEPGELNGSEIVIDSPAALPAVVERLSARTDGGPGFP